MYDDNEEKLPCGHTEAEHEEMRQDVVGAALDRVNERMEGYLPPNTPPLTGMQHDIVVRAAKVFQDLMSHPHDEPLDLFFTIKATRPSEPLVLTCKVIDRDTGDELEAYEVETLPGVMGNVELVMMLTGCLATGIAERELAEEGVDRFSA